MQPADSITTASWRCITELVPLEIPGQCHGVRPPGAGGGKSWTDLPAAWLTTTSRAGYTASAGGAGRSVVDYSILLQQGKTTTDQLLQHSAPVSSSACFHQQPAEMMQQRQANNNLVRGFATGPSDMMLMSNRSENSSTDTLAAMLASCTPAGALQASRSSGSLEDAVMGCGSGGGGGQKRPSSFYPPPPPTTSTTFDASLLLDAAGMDAADDGGDEYCGLHNAEKKRRLTFDQVRSLERNFELENKLEPERKMQLAKELGLQPRQVAVWFQNRRARWKTKQLERDYEILTQDYNRLKSELESVRDEKQELQAKVKWLTEKSTTQPEEESAAGCQAAPIGSYVQQQQSSSKLVETTATTLNHQPGATSNESPSEQLTLPEKPSGAVVEAHVFSRSSSCRDMVDDQPTRLTAFINPVSSSAEVMPSSSAATRTRKRKDGSPSSAYSTSSEILDADSPRTIDSGLNSHTIMSSTVTSSTVAASSACPGQMYVDTAAATTTTIVNVPSNSCLNVDLVMGQDLVCSRTFSDPQTYNQRSTTSAVKLEGAINGAAMVFQPADQDSCNYLLPQVDEHGALPWWDWA